MSNLLLEDETIGHTVTLVSPILDLESSNWEITLNGAASWWEVLPWAPRRWPSRGLGAYCLGCGWIQGISSALWPLGWVNQLRERPPDEARSDIPLCWDFFWKLYSEPLMDASSGTATASGRHHLHHTTTREAEDKVGPVAEGTSTPVAREDDSSLERRHDGVLGWTARRRVSSSSSKAVRQGRHSPRPRHLAPPKAKKFGAAWADSANSAGGCILRDFLLAPTDTVRRLRRAFRLYLSPVVAQKTRRAVTETIPQLLWEYYVARVLGEDFPNYNQRLIRP